MIGPQLLERLATVYSDWLDRDDFGRRISGLGAPEPAAGLLSVRQFLEELIRASSRPGTVFSLPAALLQPDSTFGQLLDSRITTPGAPSIKIETIARQALCEQIVPRLVSEALDLMDEHESTEKNLAKILAENGCKDSESLARWISSPARVTVIADTLMQALKTRLSQRTIRSLFTVEVAGNGYRLWGPHARAPGDAGSALPRHIVRTSTGDVSIDVMRYFDEDELPVRAYEWCAELRENVASETPDAIAYGMAYTFDRTSGVPSGGKWDLLTAADCIADADFLQVNTFLEQHPDAQTLVGLGDLAFVWLWERRSGTPAGAGQTCLRAALADLRRRLRRIRTVVVDLKPYQFVVSDGAGMPPQLHVEKLEAVDRLHSFVNGLHLDQAVNGECRYIVNRDQDDPDAAMRVLGLAGLAQQTLPGQGGPLQ